MNDSRTIACEPLHLVALRGLVYAGAVFLFVAPMATAMGTAAALSAVPLGLALSRLARSSRLRGPALAALALGISGVGLVVDPILGGPAWLARLFGPYTMLSLLESLGFGLATLGVVFGLRSVASRVPALRGLEVAAVAAVVVAMFAGHRDSQISQPRFLTDWVFSRGYDPRMTLLVIGLTTFASGALLLMQSQRPVKTLLSVCALLLFCVAAYLLLEKYLPDFNNPPGAGGGSSTQGKPKDEKPKPKPGQGGESKPEDQSGGSPPPPSDNDPTFAPPPPQDRPRPMAIVTLHDDLGTTSEGLYFRQNSYSQFNGSRLVRPVEGGYDQDVPATFATKREKYPCGPVDPKFQKPVPMTISLIAPHTRPIGLVSVQSMEPQPNADPRTFIQTYAVTSKVLTVRWNKLAFHKAGEPSWSKEAWDHYLAIPSDPRYRALADKIVAEANLAPEFKGSPVLRVLAIKRYLEKNMIYTLKPAVVEGVDPTTAFLFGDHRGYCVHIAHAMAYLMRAQGIPARTASGYHAGDERRGTGSSILLQSSDAHSWAEVYLQGIGWVVADAALERTEEPPPPAVDQAAQNHFGEKNRQEKKEEVYKDPASGHSLPPIRSLWPLLLTVVVPYGIKAWRRVAPRLAPEPTLYRVGYRAILDRLAEVGLIRHFGETREEFAQRVSTRVPEFVGLTEAHLRRAIGGSEAVSRRDEWLGVEAQVARRIANEFPAKRRILGRLNPVTWVWVC